MSFLHKYSMLEKKMVCLIITMSFFIYSTASNIELIILYSLDSSLTESFCGWLSNDSLLVLKMANKTKKINSNLRILYKDNIFFICIYEQQIECLNVWRLFYVLGISKSTEMRQKRAKPFEERILMICDCFLKQHLMCIVCTYLFWQWQFYINIKLLRFFFILHSRLKKKQYNYYYLFIIICAKFHLDWNFILYIFSLVLNLDLYIIKNMCLKIWKTLKYIKTQSTNASIGSKNRKIPTHRHTFSKKIRDYFIFFILLIWPQLLEWNLYVWFSYTSTI